MKRFLDLLRSPKPSSGDLRTALAANDVAAADAEHDRLTAERAAILMDADDKTLDALEARIAAARRQVERATIVQQQLTAGLAKAEAREAYEALTAERSTAEAEAVAVAKVLRTTYPKMVAEMVAVLDRLQASEKAVEAVNAKLHAADRTDERLKEVEMRTFPLGPHQHGPARTILARTRLPAIDGVTKGYLDPVATEIWPGNLPVNRMPVTPNTCDIPMGSTLANTRPKGGFVGLDR